MNEDRYLAHYGVLGMKWGVRKKQGSTNTQGSTKRQQRKEAKKLKKVAKEDAKEINTEKAKRSSDLFVNAQLATSYRLSEGELDPFGEKWNKIFEPMGENWSKSPEYNTFAKEYTHEVLKILNDSIKDNPNSTIKTKSGKEVTARFLESKGETVLVWEDKNKKG